MPKMPPWPDPPGPYAYMDEDPSFDCLKMTFKEFSGPQVQAILNENRRRNGGALVSDAPDDPIRNLGGQHPASDSPEIDHIIPKVAGGSNAYANAQVTSRGYNNFKRAKH